MQRKILIFFSFVFLLAHMAFAQKPLKVFISVDMEGIGGIGTAKMVREGGKDYGTGRRLMTDEVKAVVDAIYRSGPASILVNDSHPITANKESTIVRRRKKRWPTAVGQCLGQR